MNIYGSHYLKTKLIGSSGGLRSDMEEAIDLILSGRINMADILPMWEDWTQSLIQQLYLKKMVGEKKIVYNQINMPLTAIEDFRKLGNEDPVFEKTGGCL